MIINHNLLAINTYNRFKNNNVSASKAMNRLSSGLRINSAADDAAGATISQKMRAQIRGLQQTERNIQDGISLVKTAEAGLGSIHNPNLIRMRELCIQALNDTLTSEDRQKIQIELSNIEESIDSIANDTEFNNIKVLSAPKTKKSVGQQPVSSLDIVFLIDNSGSMMSNITNVKEGIKGFVDNLSGSLGTRVAVVNLCDPTDIKDFSSNPDDIKANLNIGAIDGTHPYEVIEKSVPGGEIGKQLSYESNSKKIFVLFTDTNNEVGTSSEELAAKKVEGTSVVSGADNDDVQVYAFLFGQSDEYYNDIIDTTGGKIYHPSGKDEIKDKLSKDLTKDIIESLPPEQSSEIEGKYEDIIIQAGANSGEEFRVELFDARTEKLGIKGLSILSREEAEDTLLKIDSAMTTVSRQRGKFGSYENALEHINNNVSNYAINVSAAESRIADADMAKETLEYTKYNMLSQASQALLAQTKDIPQRVLELFREGNKAQV